MSTEEALAAMNAAMITITDRLHVVDGANDTLGRLVRERTAERDAARYRWIRGPDEESTRYNRWRVEYFEGPNGWANMQREAMDAAIDRELTGSTK